MKQDIIKVKDAVSDVLERDAKTRTNDKWLIIEVLREMGFEIYIPYDRLNDMPSFESITRCRRKLQETKYIDEDMKNIGDWFE